MDESGFNGELLGMVLLPALIDSNTPHKSPAFFTTFSPYIYTSFYPFAILPFVCCSTPYSVCFLVSYVITVFLLCILRWATALL